MSSSLRRGALAASAIVFSIASLAACGAGSDSQTLQVKPDNAATAVGDIKVQNAVVITQPDLQSTGPAVISAFLYNDGSTDQTLQSVSLPGSSETVKLTPAKGGSLTVPAHGSLLLGGKDNASAELPNGRSAVKDGNAQQLTFTFSKTGPVSLKAFVVPATSYFDKWGPSTIPSAPASPSGAPGASASPGGKPEKGKGKGGKATPSAGASTGTSAGTPTGATPSGSASQSAAGH